MAETDFFLAEWGHAPMPRWIRHWMGHLIKMLSVDESIVNEEYGRVNDYFPIFIWIFHFLYLPIVFKFSIQHNAKRTSSGATSGAVI